MAFKRDPCGRVGVSVRPRGVVLRVGESTLLACDLPTVLFFVVPTCEISRHFLVGCLICGGTNICEVNSRVAILEKEEDTLQLNAR